MIEPLRFNMEKALPFSVDRPVFCSACQLNKATRKNPNIAVKFCPDCQKHRYLCKTCDEEAHDLIAGPPHVRRILVVGPAVRKKVLVRGDRKNFPLPMDMCKIQISSNVYHEGSLIHKEQSKDIEFVAGLSGKSCHVQILGAGDLLAADDNGTSDPFVTAVYNGVPMHTTRYRQRTLNPRWNNESIIVPLSDTLPDARGALRSQHQLLKLEMYDYDWWNANDFLGHVEITKSKLQKLAERSNQQPVRLPLTLREFHGLLGIQMGMKERNFFIKVIRGECLDKMDPTGLSDPYVKVFFGDKYLGKTPVHSNTLDPTWKVFNVFKLNLNDVIRREKEILREKRNLMGRSLAEENKLALFRLELYDFNYFRSHGHLGTVHVPVEYLRKMCKFVPKMIMSEQSFRHKLMHNFGNSRAASDRDLSKDDDLGPGSFMNVSSRWFNASTRDEEDEDLNKDDLHPEVDEDHDHSGEEDDVFNMVKNHANTKSMKVKKTQPPSPAKPPLGPATPNLAEKRKGMLQADFYSKSMSAMTPIIEPDDGDLAGAATMPAAPSMRSPPRPLPPPETEMEVDHFGEANQERSIPLLEDVAEGWRQPERERLGSDPIEPLSGGEPQVDWAGSSVDNAPSAADEGVRASASGSRPGSALAAAVSDAGSRPVSSTGPSDGEMRARAESETAAPMLGGGSRPATASSRPGSSGGAAGTEGVAASSDSAPPSPLTVSRPNSAAGREQLPSRPSTAGENGENATEIVMRVPDTESPMAKPAASNLNPIKEADQSEATGEDEADQEEDNDEESSDEEENKGFLGRLRSGFSSMQAGFISIFKKSQEDEEILLQRKKDSEIKWSNLRHFPVTRQVSSANVVDPDIVDRGYILARLVISNRGNVVPGLDEGVRQMTLGETSLLKVRFDYAYNSYAMGANIPPRSNVVFKVHLKAINDMNWRGMPWRQVKRCSRMTRRCIERTCWTCTYVVMRIVRTKQVAWLMKTLFGITIDIGDSDSESDDESEYEEESSEDVSRRPCSLSIVTLCV